MKPRMKTLEAQAFAAGSAFGFHEEDFEAPRRQTGRGRFALAILAAGAAFGGLAHQLGLGQIVATLGGWKAVG